MSQDSISTYGDFQLFAYALEKAGKADKEAVAEVIRNVDLTDGPAMYYSGTRLQFDANGRNEGAKLVIVQWQGGEPKAVFPPEAAVSEPVWHKQ
jgi:branched-chain amino acid transport system substrate-binding protein